MPILRNRSYYRSPAAPTGSVLQVFAAIGLAELFGQFWRYKAFG